MAADSKIEVQIKKVDGIWAKEVAKKEGDEKWDIKIVEDQKIEFAKREDKEKGKKRLRVKAKKSKEEDKEANWKDGEVEVKCSKGFFRETYEIEPKIYSGTSTTVTLAELKESPKNLSTDVHSFRWGFYGIITVGVIAVGLLIWWIMSSSKEDKEAESL